MTGGRQSWFQRRRQLPVWPLAVVVVIGLGVWGFASLKAPGSGGQLRPALHPVDDVYRTVRLFALEFDVPPETSAPWQLWIAAFAAPLLTARGIARLFQEQVGAFLAHYFVRPRLVVFGANERGAALIAAEPRPGRWRDAIVVVDPDPGALGTVTAPRVWTVRGHGTSAGSLRNVGVHRAANVVVVTGDNERNSSITTAVLDLTPTPALDLYVEVEEAGLARTLEQGGHRAGVQTVPFSASALAAAAVLDEFTARGDPSGPASLLTADEDGSGPTLALFGTGGLVDAFVLELHRRRQVQLLEDVAAAGAVPRVLMLGPDASQRRRTLASLLGTEVQLLDLDAFDVRLDQVVELEIETARHLTRNRPLRQIFVLAPSDLDGGGIAITLARHLGPRAQLVLVTESGSTPFGDEIEEQTRDSATLAKVRLFRTPQRAYTLATLRAERISDRLGRALYTAGRSSAERDWNALLPRDRDRLRAEAAERVRAAGAGQVPLRRAALVAPSAPEIPLLAALGFDQPTALAGAGLRADFQSVAVLLPSAQRLLQRGHDTAFGAWCEVARLHSEPAQIAVAAPGPADGPDAGDVLALLMIRRAQLGDTQARAVLTEQPVADGCAGGVPVIVLAGPDDPVASVSLLEPALGQVPAIGDLQVVASPGAFRDELVRRGGRAGSGSTRHQQLAIWRSLVLSGIGGHRIRVIVLPGAATEDILLARALGAVIGRVQQGDAADLGRILLNGAAGVVPMPPDRMTIRAFLRPGTWPHELAGLREPLAAELHRCYVARQWARKPQDDLAMQPWAELSPWLQRSNLAVVDDIPVKLAALGFGLDGTCGSDPLPALSRAVHENTELLAELEHGRYTAERLLSGWTSGVREPARFLSPYLLPWTRLDEQAKEYDREVVRDLPGMLAAHRLGVRPLEA